jgi:hypothetical protein
VAFTPNTTVYLLDTPLDNKYKNEILFADGASQYDYFSGRIAHRFDGVTYQRKDNVIRVDSHIDELWDVNYAMYQNANFGSKWFYAFITKMEYVSDRATDIYIETDVFQTWLFECMLMESFVVREHVSDDTIGKHLVDEQLETGEFIMDSYAPVGKLGVNWNILAVSDVSLFGSTDATGNLYGHVATGLTYYPFPNTTQGIQWMKDTIKIYTDAGKQDAIILIFTVPYLLIKSAIEDPAWTLGYPIPSGTPFGWELFDEPKHVSNVNGYNPRNNKLFTYPYKFLYASNSDGLSATYRYEDFKNDLMNFMIFGPITPNPKVMLAPNDYKGDGLKYEHGLTLTGYPLCSWTTDTYAAWLAQNGASTAVAMIGSTAALVGGVASGNLLAAGGGALGIAKELSEIHKAQIQPDQAKGQAGSGNLMYGTNALDFYFAHMTIKAEFAKRIDAFFTMYGYKVNTLKIPETHSRLNWNYIQTIDINIVGQIPSNDMNRLKKAYDEGITLWHNPEHFLDYDLLNPII